MANNKKRRDFIMEWTVVYEISCNRSVEPNDVTNVTIWVLPGIRKEDSFESSYTNYGEIEGSMRFVGPIPMDIANSVFESLKSILKDSGCEVYDYVTADD